MRLYFDYNATTPLCPPARVAIEQTLVLVGNASSVHHEGRQARALIETARQQVKALVGGENVVFTSGGSEACNLALHISQAPAGEITRLLVSAGEHSAVLETARHRDVPVSHLPLTSDGVIQLDALAEALQDPSPALVAVMAANNETGVCQPLKEIGEQTRTHGSVFFCDAVQGAGKIPLSMEAMKIDCLSLSAHKIGGPAGVGALLYAPHITLTPQLYGGGQELRQRAGSENLLGIAGFGAAALAQDSARYQEITPLRDDMEKQITTLRPDAVIFGKDVPRLPNTSCFAVAGLSSEVVLMSLDLQGIAVSAGSACSSGKVAPSHVLQAMGVKPALSQSAIRVSLGQEHQPDDITAFVSAWRQIATQKEAL